MALRLRRGTDAERLLITPLEGELIYTTDTKKLYVGDGITIGGIAVDTTGNGSGLADLSNSSINDLADVNADSTLPADGEVLSYDAASGDWRSVALGLLNLADVNASGIADGQIIAWDAAVEAFVPTNNLGGVGATFVGDVVGSVFADDSTLLVDSINGEFFGNLTGNVTGDVTGDVIGNTTGFHTGNVKGSSGTNVLIPNTGPDDAILRLLDITATGTVNALLFEGNLTGNVTGDVIGNTTGFHTGNVKGSSGDNILVTNTGPADAVLRVFNIVADGTIDANLIEGNLTGNVTGNLFGDVEGSVFADDSTLLVDGVNAEIKGRINTDLEAYFEGPVNFGRFTSANNKVNYFSTSTNGFFSDSVINVANIHDDPVYCNELGLFRARGTVDTQTSAQVNDLIGTLSWAAYDGNLPQVANAIKSEITSISTNNITADLCIYTRNGAIGTFSKKLTIQGSTEGGMVAEAFIQFGSYTTAERDNLTAANGMVLYNETTNKFQGYAGGAWVDLH